MVVGAGMAAQGYNQQQAADEWASQTHHCGSGPVSEVDCPDNPYSGGGTKIVGGFIITIIGGVVVYVGTRQ